MRKYDHTRRAANPHNRICTNPHFHSRLQLHTHTETHLNHIPHDTIIERASHGRGADGHLQLQNAHQHDLVAARVRRLEAAPRDGVGDQCDCRDAAGAVRG